ncbi:MAG: DUF6265 family protein [Anaerolineales bacterium]
MNGRIPSWGIDGCRPRPFGGHWAGRAGENSIEEIWGPIAGEILMGMYRWIKDRFFIGNFQRRTARGFPTCL